VHYRFPAYRSPLRTCVCRYTCRYVHVVPLVGLLPLPTVTAPPPLHYCYSRDCGYLPALRCRSVVYHTPCSFCRFCRFSVFIPAVHRYRIFCSFCISAGYIFYVFYRRFYLLRWMHVSSLLPTFHVSTTLPLPLRYVFSFLHRFWIFGLVVRSCSIPTVPLPCLRSTVRSVAFPAVSPCFYTLHRLRSLPFLPTAFYYHSCFYFVHLVFRLPYHRFYLFHFRWYVFTVVLPVSLHWSLIPHMIFLWPPPSSTPFLHACTTIPYVPGMYRHLPPDYTLPRWNRYTCICCDTILGHFSIRGWSVEFLPTFVLLSWFSGIVILHSHSVFVFLPIPLPTTSLPFHFWATYVDTDTILYRITSVVCYILHTMTYHCSFDVLPDFWYRIVSFVHYLHRCTRLHLHFIYVLFAFFDLKVTSIHSFISVRDFCCSTIRWFRFRSFYKLHFFGCYTSFYISTRCCPRYICISWTYRCYRSIVLRSFCCSYHLPITIFATVYLVYLPLPFSLPVERPLPLIALAASPTTVSVDRYVRRFYRYISTVSPTAAVRHSTLPPSFPFWYDTHARACNHTSHRLHRSLPPTTTYMTTIHCISWYRPHTWYLPQHILEHQPTITKVFYRTFLPSFLNFGVYISCSLPFTTYIISHLNSTVPFVCVCSNFSFYLRMIVPFVSILHLLEEFTILPPLHSPSTLGILPHRLVPFRCSTLLLFDTIHRYLFVPLPPPLPLSGIPWRYDALPMWRNYHSPFHLPLPPPTGYVDYTVRSFWIRATTFYHFWSLIWRGPVPTTTIFHRHFHSFDTVLRCTYRLPLIPPLGLPLHSLPSCSVGIPTVPVHLILLPTVPFHCPLNYLPTRAYRYRYHFILPSGDGDLHHLFYLHTMILPRDTPVDIHHHHHHHRFLHSWYHHHHHFISTVFVPLLDFIVVAYHSFCSFHICHSMIPTITITTIIVRLFHLYLIVVHLLFYHSCHWFHHHSYHSLPLHILLIIQSTFGHSSIFHFCSFHSMLTWGLGGDFWYRLNSITEYNHSPIRCSTISFTFLPFPISFPAFVF